MIRKEGDMMRKLLTVLLIWLIIGMRVSAQEPESSYVFFLPIIGKAPPWPYDMKAVDFVLWPADMPGYILDEEESGSVHGSCAEDSVDAYMVTYWDYDQLFSGTPLVAEIAAVFGTPQAAHYFFRCYRDLIASDPGLKLISAPRMGDESMAGKTLLEPGDEDNPFSATAYIIVVRKGNLIIQVGTSALSFAADFNMTKHFTERAYTKLEDVITGSTIIDRFAVSEDLSIERQKVYRGQLESVKELLYLIEMKEDEK